MEYTVASTLKVLDKEFGEKVSEQELLDAGANIAALLASGNIATNAPQARPQVAKEEPKAPVFNTEYKEQGDK
jgi:hypothetical protein